MIWEHYREAIRLSYVVMKAYNSCIFFHQGKLSKALVRECSILSILEEFLGLWEVLCSGFNQA